MRRAHQVSVVLRHTGESLGSWCLMWLSKMLLPILYGVLRRTCALELEGVDGALVVEVFFELAFEVGLL